MTLVLDQTDTDWPRFLALAERQRITARQMAGTPNSERQTWIVTSGSTTGLRYAVEIECGPAGVSYRCGCDAHRHDLPCKHVALVLEAIHMLPASEPIEAA